MPYVSCKFLHPYLFLLIVHFAAEKKGRTLDLLKESSKPT